MLSHFIQRPFALTLLIPLFLHLTLWAQDDGDRLVLAAPGHPGWTEAIQATNGQLTVESAHIEVFFPGNAQGVLELTLEPKPADWSGYAGIAFDISNVQDIPLEIAILVESVLPDGTALQSRRNVAVPGKVSMVLPFYFTNNNLGPYWGMRGIPVYYQMATTLVSERAANIHLPGITRAAVEVRAAAEGSKLRVRQVALFTPESSLAELVPYPFIDAFGQFIHADWPGKIQDEAALAAAAGEEQQALADNPFPLPLDDFGGWLEGPELDATGWFRTELLDGRWWLVTPGGRLFLSMGANCVHYGDATFVEGRDRWFEGLPDPDGPFAEVYGHVSGVHSNAEPIGGKGRSINHYRLNLQRKYGEGWREQAAIQAEKRLRAWGFNTIGNWSDSDVLARTTLPFTVTAGSGSARLIEGGPGGYWGRMKDVFDPAFSENTEDAIARSVAPHANEPRVIGVFVDNEMSWSNIAESVLDSPPDQPARLAFVEMLRERYGNISALNDAWGLDAEGWQDVRAAHRTNRVFRQDCMDFEYQFARRYFETVAAALHRTAPNHLYLGCRFTPMYCPDPVLRACADVADVVSLNLYYKTVPLSRYADLGKPILIGEFHFGALDRGMFHTGLQAASDQKERAALYSGYVESLLAHPAAVGAQWFQYMDQPTTGRTLDGENYNIGLVSIADVPYPELTRSARDIHGRMYRMRLEQR